jgi:hypothetical protein
MDKKSERIWYGPTEMLKQLGVPAMKGDQVVRSFTLLSKEQDPSPEGPVKSWLKTRTEPVASRAFLLMCVLSAKWVRMPIAEAFWITWCPQSPLQKGRWTSGRGLKAQRPTSRNCILAPVCYQARLRDLSSDLLSHNFHSLFPTAGRKSSGQNLRALKNTSCN